MLSICGLWASIHWTESLEPWSNSSRNMFWGGKVKALELYTHPVSVILWAITGSSLLIFNLKRFVSQLIEHLWCSISHPNAQGCNQRMTSVSLMGLSCLQPPWWHKLSWPFAVWCMWAKPWHIKGLEKEVTLKSLHQKRFVRCGQSARQFHVGSPFRERFGPGDVLRSPSDGAVLQSSLTCWMELC